MNILNLLTKQKHVAGIEISDSVVRIAFFRSLKKKSNSLTKDSGHDDELILIEEPIASNIIEDGVVIDIDLLGKTLKNIWTKASLDTEYAIVAIPDDKIYSKVFSFPKSINEARVTEAMRLAVSFQLPMKTGDVYLDWERTAGTTTTNEILLSTIPRPVAEGYVQALEKAGIKTLALESNLSAIARAVKLLPNETVIFSKKTPDGATIFALRDGLLRFSRTLPQRYIPENNIPDEIAKISTAIAAEAKGVVSVQNFLDAEIKDEYVGLPGVTDPKSKWLISLGAVIRGRIPEGEDNLVSLLPIGTEEAYSYQKATTFIIFMRNIIIGVSLFFIVAYFAAYLFMMTLLKNTAAQVISLSSLHAPDQLTEKEQAVNDINVANEVGASFIGKTPIWSNVIQEVLSVTTQGIVISAFSAPSLTDRLSLTGIAMNRNELNDYKKALQDSSLFSEIDLPLNNLEQKGEIPFTISFRLKNPSAFYYK